MAQSPNEQHYNTFLMAPSPNGAESKMSGPATLAHGLESEVSDPAILVHGSGFSKERGTGHVRLVHLADPDTLNEAFDRIERFLGNS